MTVCSWIVCLLIHAVCGTVPTPHLDSTQQAVSEQYHDYPYPAYDTGEETRDREHYILHTDCTRGQCQTVPRNVPYILWYMFTIALSPLNHHLYKVRLWKTLMCHVTSLTLFLYKCAP